MQGPEMGRGGLNDVIDLVNGQQLLVGVESCETAVIGQVDVEFL
jgi:hypothetical protein